MVTSADFLKVAQQLKVELNGQAFITKPRMEITDLFREANISDNYRLKSAAADRLETALLYQGIRVYPSLVDTTTNDVVRLFHVNTVIASLVDALDNPSDETDKYLANVINKVKGKWN